MKIYLVGGAVRDKLLGLPIKERDWVVVGATEADMLKLGYRQVGKEFPVFLHPKTNEEYALARRERKVDKGYKGFTFDTSPQVSLEDDLLRRDLTINAMAETAEGVLIDPYHGKTDLEQKFLRHVSLAFAEDPVRILRVGRFLARFASLGFQVAPETYTLMQEMVAKGEVEALVAERVWKELERALGEKNPEKFFEVLEKSHALAILFPTLTADSAGIAALKAAKTISHDSLIRFATLFYTLDHPKKNLAAIFTRYRIPNQYRELSNLIAFHHETALNVAQLNAQQLLDLLNALDIFRREERFEQFLLAMQAIAQAKQVPFNKEWLKQAAKVVKAVPVKPLLDQGYTDAALAEQLKILRLEKLNGWVKNSHD